MLVQEADMDYIKVRDKEEELPFGLDALKVLVKLWSTFDTTKRRAAATVFGGNKWMAMTKEKFLNCGKQ